VSISLKEILEKAASQVSDPEGLLYGDLDQAMCNVVKALFETLATSEVEQRAGVRLHERSGARQDYRNGYRCRRIQTSYRVIEVRIPRLRGQGYVPSFLEPGHRAIKEVERWVGKAFMTGLSRSEVIRLLESTTGCQPSESVLRRVQAELDRRVKAFQDRELVGDYEYVFLDAAWAKDIVGLHATRVCILTAIGVTREGKKEIVGYERAAIENESAWRGFLGRLVKRGLKPSRLSLVISDEHGGLLKAAGEVFGDVPHQLCWAHRCRNVRKAVAAEDRKAVIEGLRAIYKAAHLTAAKGAFRAFKACWAEKYGSLVASIEQDLGRLLAFYSCASVHWEYVRTSNPIERAFRELRRQQFGCGAFANRDSCNRAVFRVFNWLNERWEDQDIWEPRTRKLKASQPT